jgi:hypothetical protein
MQKALEREAELAGSVPGYQPQLLEFQPTHEHADEERRTLETRLGQLIPRTVLAIDDAQELVGEKGSTKPNGR